MSKVPNPGSDKAIELGCTCARLDNCYGAGFLYPRRDGLDPAEHPSFYVTANCPLHDREHGESMLATETQPAENIDYWRWKAGDAEAGRREERDKRVLAEERQRFAEAKLEATIESFSIERLTWQRD